MCDMTVSDKQMNKHITNGKTIQASAVGERVVIKITKGEHFRIIETNNSEQKDARQVIAIKKGDALVARFNDDSVIEFKNFYQECVEEACSVTLANEDDEGYVITGDSPLGVVTADGDLVYAHGEHTSLMEMAAIDEAALYSFKALGEGLITYIPYEQENYYGYVPSISSVLVGGVVLATNKK